MRPGVFDRTRRIFDAAQRTRAAIDYAPVWFPYPILLSFGLVLLFTGHIVPSLNPRLGNHAQVIQLTAPPEPRTRLWLAVTVTDTEAIISTSDRQVIRWSLDGSTAEAETALRAHLDTLVQEKAMAASLSKMAFASVVTVAIAVDERVLFSHLRPVLYALAAAGITNYGFETIQPGEHEEPPPIAKIPVSREAL